MRADARGPSEPALTPGPSPEGRGGKEPPALFILVGAAGTAALHGPEATATPAQRGVMRQFMRRTASVRMLTSGSSGLMRPSKCSDMASTALSRRGGNVLSVG